MRNVAGELVCGRKECLKGRKMIIRKYCDNDEQAWIRCRAIAFLDSSYWNDVKTEKEKYDKPSISLIAEKDGQIIGFIDTEIDSEHASCCREGERNAVIWHLGVLPEYRRLSMAKKLWEETKKRLLAENIHYCEVWTQEDEPANRFYQKMGFTLEEDQTWLRCYSQGRRCAELLNEKLGDIYGPEQLIFDAPVSRREELKDFCYRMDEVRLYSIRF
ncbi:MAG: GNAT family N-acetyltransferase [Christensenellales bacterium]|jgi:ribosomal protein S18 acetylase RimI-like enzyme